MMTRILLATVALVCSGTWTLSGAAPEEDTAIRIGGSTTLLPAIAQCASDFMEKYETWDKVDPSLPKDKTVIFVTGGGSGFGSKALLQGAVHIGMVSRELKDEEKKALGDPQAVLVGRDCVTFAASKKSPLVRAKPGFTRDELARIFSGELKRYSEIDASLPDKAFALFVRDASGGAAEVVQKEVLKKREVSPDAVQIPSQGAMLKKLEGNPNGFGYIAMGLVHQSDELHAFAVDGIEATRANVLNGTYPLSRNLYLVTKGKPDVRAQRFIDYVAREGQRVLETQGYIPASAEEK